MLILLILTSLVFSSDCTTEFDIQNDQGQSAHYDISGLVQSTWAWNASSSASGTLDKYFYAVCEIQGDGIQCDPSWAMCQDSGLHPPTFVNCGILSQNSAGPLPTSLGDINQGFQLNYTGGASSSTKCFERSTVINFVCSQGGKTEMGSVTQKDGEKKGSQVMCLYEFQISSPEACPHGGTDVVGWIMIIIFFSCVLLYCGVGMGINAYRQKGCRFPEVIPQHAFWMDLPYLVKDGAMFIGRKTCCKGASPAGYEPVK